MINNKTINTNMWCAAEYRRILRSIPVACLLGLIVVEGADWPQYRGANHDGISPERILKPWPANGPTPLWKIPLNAGFSSFAIHQGRAFTLVKQSLENQEKEVCLALDANTGQELWGTPVGEAKYEGGGDSGTPDNRGGDGPRSTPSADGDAVYVLSAYLGLSCLEAKTGKVLWQKDLVQELGGKLIPWKSAASPLIEGDLIFLNANAPGACLTALNKRTGAVVWKGQDDKMTHATPVAATIHGVRQIIFFTQSGLVAVAPLDGKVLWTYRFRYSVSTAASPVVADNIVYCSAGYNVGSAAVKISLDGDNFIANEIWKVTGNKIANHWSTPVYADGYLYGLFGFKEYGECPLKCVELATGKEMWSAPGFGPGGLLLADGHLVVLGDRGQLVLVKASPDQYQEVSRFQAIAGKCWNAPALSDGRIYARSTQQGICLDVAP